MARRRRSTPYFNVVPPVNPLTGEQAGLFRQDPAYLATMRVKEIHDDYLICEGWDPYTRAYYTDHRVAMPMALRQWPVQTIEMPDGSTRTVGTALADAIQPPYFVGELIVAARMGGYVGDAVPTPVVDGTGKLLTPAQQTLPGAMPYEGLALYPTGTPTTAGSTAATPVYWVDLNVAGRNWGAGTPLYYGRTQENWRKNGSDPRVKVRRVTGTPKRTATETDTTDIWVYLPRSRPGDPNVVANTNIAYMTDEDGEAVCVSDYLDDKIGTLKMWLKTQGTIPAGWALVDGIENAAGNGGTGYSFDTGLTGLHRFPRAAGVDAGGDHALGGVGGAATDTLGNIADHDLATGLMSAEGAHHHGGITGLAGGHYHGITAAADHAHIISPGGSAHAHTIAVTTDGAHTHSGSAALAALAPSSETVVIADHTGTTAVGYASFPDHYHDIIPTLIGYAQPSHTYGTGHPVHLAYNTEPASLSEAGHTHGLGTITHSVTHSVTAHTHTIADHGHTITVGSDGDHTHTATIPTPGGAHDHGGTTLDAGAHDHGAATGAIGDHGHGIAGEYNHTHTLSGLLGHSGHVDTIPPFLNVYFIERIDNSAGD